MPVLPSVRDSSVAALLQQGHVGVLPTDTIYGLAARALDRAAVVRLYALKSREHKPGTIIAATIDQLIDMGLDAGALRQVAHLWPNPLSIIIPTGPGLEYLHQDVGSLAVRLPADDDLHALLLKVGPLVTTSANSPGEPPADTIAEAQRYFQDNVDFYVDGGDLSNRPPSTVARITDKGLEVLRQGAIKLTDRGEITA